MYERGILFYIGFFYLKQILKKRQKKSTSCYNEGGKFLIFGDSYAIAVAGVFFLLPWGVSFSRFDEHVDYSE